MAAQVERLEESCNLARLKDSSIHQKQVLLPCPVGVAVAGDNAVSGVEAGMSVTPSVGGVVRHRGGNAGLNVNLIVAVAPLLGASPCDQGS